MKSEEMCKRLAWAWNYLDEHDDIENAKALIGEVSAALASEKPLVVVDGWLPRNTLDLLEGPLFVQGIIYREPEPAIQHYLLPVRVIVLPLEPTRQG